MILSGIFDLPWWGYVVVALVLTHITIAAVTIFLHRCHAHRALDLHPVISHFFRFWLWLTTGMVTKEWVAVHRKHHARCETEEDPHSPQIYGINRVLWRGVGLYKDEAVKNETLEKYGLGTPDDWLERNVYTPHNVIGIASMAIINLVLFGLVPGILIFLTQMIWIPLFAAGVINGIGHYWGYRNFTSEDASTNIVPWGILIGGEELHNNHHAYASSARLSNKWYEFDIGWFYIRTLEIIGFAKVKKLAPRVQFTPGKSQCDTKTLEAVITHRYDVMSKFAKTILHVYADETAKLRRKTPHLSLADQETLRTVKRYLHINPAKLADSEQSKLSELFSFSNTLHTAHVMRLELASLWERSTASQEQLLKQLEDWCHRAEASGIEALQAFSKRLRSYA